VGFFIIILFLFYRLGPQHLEYDSDGEVIHIQTEDVFWSKYFPRKKTTMDFPKNKLISFRIQQAFPKKTLELFVKSKRSPNGVTKLRFNITYLSSSEISDMKRSLSKIVRNNRELTTHIEETADDE